MKTINQFIMLLIVILGIVGCSDKLPQKAYKGMQSPQTFILNGDRFLESNRPKAALASYEQALRRKKNPSKALAGKALALAQLSYQEKARHGQNEWEQMLDEAKSVLEDAQHYAKNSDEKDRVSLFRIRYWLEKEKGARIYNADSNREEWIKWAEKQFDQLEDDPKYGDAAHYYMAGIYDMNGRYPEAAQLLLAVKSNLSKYGKKAARSLKSLYSRLMVGSTDHPEVHRVMALSQVSRADVAVLLTLYFPMEELVKNRQGIRVVEYAPPVSRLPQVRKASDVQGHPLAVNVEQVIKLKLRGLRVLNGKFDNNTVFTRGEFALVLEDILRFSLNLPKLHRQYVGEKSSFQDVPSTHASFNAVKTVTERGLLPVRNLKTAYFALNEPVNGLEMLQSLSKLKQELNIL